MTDFGMISNRLESTSAHLREFNESVRLLKIGVTDPNKLRELSAKLLRVLDPLSKRIEGRLSRYAYLDDSSVLTTLMQKRSKSWSELKSRLLRITHDLQVERYYLSVEDFVALEDVADAIDAECSRLFKRMSGRR